MKTKNVTKKDWDKVLGMHQLFNSINEAVIKNYRNISPLEALNLIFGPHGVVCDGVATLYPNTQSDNEYFLRVERIDGETRYNLDLQTMPRGEGGFLKKALTFTEPEIYSDLTSEITEKDLKVLPWLAQMKTALVVPTIGVTGKPATSILFAYQEDAFSYEIIWRNVILTYAITNIILNLLLRTETDKAYKALDEEFATIGRIQRQLLPERLPDVDGLQWAVHYSTSTRAGGDYYDFFHLPENQTGVIIADVSGHGSPAAVVMAMTRLLLHSYPGEVRPPLEVLQNINRLLLGNILPGQFVTAFYGIIDLGARTLTFSNAGHCHPRLLRASGNAIEKLEVKGGLPLGISDNGNFQQMSIRLNKGDILLFFTDGVMEAVNKSGEMFGEWRLDGILKDLSGKSAEEIKNTLLEDVLRFCEGVPLKDDLTIVVAKVTK